MQKRKGSSDALILVFSLLLIGAVVFYMRGGNIGVTQGTGEGTSLPFNLKLPDFNIIVNVPEQDDDTPSDQDTPPPPPPPDGNPQDYKVPTSLTVFISPNPVNRGDFFIGDCISNGYNTEVTLYAKHKGSGETVSFGGWLGDDGKFQHVQQINVAGYWEFWATADNGKVESNHATLTVQGFHILQDGHVSMSLDPTQIIRVYSHMSGNVQLIAIDHAMGMSIPLTSTSINSGGFGDVLVDFSGRGMTGDYELEAIHSNGQTASGWDGTSWVHLGR